MKLQISTLALCLLACASALAAQNSGAAANRDDTKAALSKSFNEVSGWVSKAAEAVPADKYSYRPAKSVRTFGELIGHIADSYNYYCARAAPVTRSNGLIRLRKGPLTKPRLFQSSSKRSISVTPCTDPTPVN